MKTNNDPSPLQVRLSELARQLSDDPMLGPLVQPGQLENFLQCAFSELLQAALLKERQFHLEDHPTDRANGFAPKRTLQIGTTPVSLQVPRTREAFYPAVLPKHQRVLPESYQRLLEDVLLQAKSFKAALRTLQAMGLPYAPDQLEDLLLELDLQAKEFFSRPLASDWFFLFIDAKVIELKDEQDHIKKAVHFLVIGVSWAGRKEVLTAQSFWGNEALEAWRQVLIGLKNRGLTRALFIVTDDFSGLTPLIKSLLPGADHQLCCVHLFRNAHRHLNSTDFQLFKQTWKEICATSSFEAAAQKFQWLLDQLRPQNRSFVDHLQQRKSHYLAFMKYPNSIRGHIRSTNLPEGINNLIETIRRNSGGHFHSQREARIKLKLLVDQLYQGRWKSPNRHITAVLQPLTTLFRQRFESELPSDQLLTQTF